MKKKMISFASLGLVCATFFISCTTKNQSAEAQLENALVTPAKIISNEKAAKLYQNDQQTRLSQIGKEHTRFEDKVIHFDLPEIERYIDRLEQLKAANIPVTGASFVFGADADGKRIVFLMPSTRNAALDYQESFTIENDTFLTFKHVIPTLQTKKTSKNDENLILSPDGYLSFNQAVDLFNQYQHEYIQPFAKKVTKEYYTKAVWYSLEEFHEYIDYLKKKSEANHLAITGIDVFFGVYDTDVNLELRSNAQTIFLAASTTQETIVNTTGKSLQSITTDEFVNKESESTEESLTYNLGEVSPPPPRYCLDENGNIIICDTQ